MKGDFILNNSAPIYKQLVDEIKVAILAGEVKPGERLPSVRDFAEKLKVNPNTLQRALMELENEKLIYTERTNGKFVTADKKMIEKIRMEYAHDLTREYRENMQRIGIKI